MQTIYLHEFVTFIAAVGVEPYAGTVAFVRQLRQQGFKIAVVTSSQNCNAVVQAGRQGNLGA